MAGHIYTATISWRRGDGDFAKGRYSRAHTWRFDGGIEVPASASPAVVQLPHSVEAAIDPEEAYVASLSSCHMLTFVDLARRAGFTVDAYEDTAEGVMDRLEAGRWWISKVTLRPRIVFSGEKRPDEIDLADLHHKAHDTCFIANSVKTEIEIAPLDAEFSGDT
jgi:organic hydroperoxide reductase OsmC/OhrA